MPDYATQALYCCAATNVSLQKLSLHKGMQVSAGVQATRQMTGIGSIIIA